MTRIPTWTRLVPWCCAILGALRCSHPASRDTAAADVVWVLPVGSGTRALTAFGSSLAPGVHVNLYAVDSPADARELCAVLRSRGDSVLVGVGRPMWEVMRTCAGWSGRLWVGWNDPGPGDDRVLRWWAPVDSVIASVVRQAGPARVRVLGQPSETLRALLNEPGPGGASPPDGALLPELTLLLDAAQRSQAPGAAIWAAECPFVIPDGVCASVSMDWEGAVRAALEWWFSRRGVPPGPTLGPWLNTRVCHAG